MGPQPWCYVRRRGIACDGKMRVNKFTFVSHFAAAAPPPPEHRNRYFKREHDIYLLTHMLDGCKMFSQQQRQTTMDRHRQGGGGEGKNKHMVSFSISGIEIGIEIKSEN